MPDDDTENWKKTSRGNWEWVPDNRLTLQIYHDRPDKFYYVDLWYEGNHQSLDGSSFSSDAKFIAEEFMKDNPDAKEFWCKQMKKELTPDSTEEHGKECDEWGEKYRELLRGTRE